LVVNLGQRPSKDGELLIVPQLGRLRLATEFGTLDIEPQQVAVIPRGLRFRVELPDGQARGYVCENFGAPGVGDVLRPRSHEDSPGRSSLSDRDRAAATPSPSFLEDGDRLTLRGWCEKPGYPRVGCGEVAGTVLPATSVQNAK
jgi:hypothetical protein